MIDRCALFQTAHALARRERGMCGIQQTCRQASAIALRKLLQKMTVGNEKAPTGRAGRGQGQGRGQT